MSRNPRPAGAAAPGDTRVAPRVEDEVEVVESLSPLWRVLCHDDPITTMDFVVDVLIDVFRLPLPAATRLMLEVHTRGVATVGRWPESLARSRAGRARAKARAASFPLAFSVEPDS